MFIIIFILSAVVLTRTLSYSFYEIKTNKNMLGGLFIILLAIIAFLLPLILIYFRGTF